jgi:mono/diheme cytochrome c family protein
MQKFALAALVALAASPAFADDVKLKPGAGLDKLEANCQACHTLAYIPMNSPFLNAAGWDAEVAKMRGPYGAPIDDADAKAIADYLKANYGG